MRKSFIKHILCLLGAVLVLSGCYRDELADIHNQIDDLDLRTIREQIEGMKEGVANLQELQKWIEPAVENLQASKQAIEAEIEDLKARLAEAGAATEELKDELAFKEAQLGNLEKTIAGLESVSAALVERVKELEAAVKAPTTGLSDRVMALETAWQGMATIEELADLEEYADGFSGDFGENFFKSLEECKQQLSQWVSESTAIQQMFDKYYDCAYLDAEISGLNGVDGTQDASLAEIGTSVSGLKAELQKMINDAINGVADEYESSLEDIENTIKTIQNDIADQYALLWAKIGREDLAIEGTIVSVINTLIERFGTLDGKAGDIDAIISALRTDLNLFRSDFIKILASEAETYNGETLAGLHALLIELQGKLDGKADNTNVERLIGEAKKLTADVQTALEKYIADNNAALEAYIKKAEQDYLTNADAEKLKESFALISNLSALDASITGFDTGEGAFIERGEWDSTVMGLISKLNVLVGIGEDGAADKPKQGWTNTIVEAVNDLYVLVNGKLNEAEATEVAIGIVNGFINELLGVKEGGTAKQVKDLLDGFADSINKLGGSIDTLVEKIGLKDLGAALGDDPDIAIAIARIKSSISGIKEALAGISGNYAGKRHGHDGKDITDLAEAISKEIDAITGKLSVLRTEAKETLVAAINELHDKFGRYYEKEGEEGEISIKSLLSNLEAVLAAAVRDGGSGLEGYFANLNLNALKTNIDNIVNTGGTIDSFVATIENLNLTDFIKILEDLPFYQFVSFNDENDGRKVSESLDILVALSSLNVTLGEDVFEYGELDDAIAAVNKALTDHISNYSELDGTFDDIQYNLEKVGDMLGQGFSASNTVSDVLGSLKDAADGLDDVFEGLGAGETVKSLTDGLRGLFDALIDALLGKSGSADDIDGTNNLNALQARLDAIGFSTIRGKIKEGGEEQSLAQVLGIITSSIETLNNTIGKGSLGDGKKVIDVLMSLSTELGNFNYDDYDNWTNTIDNKIDDILDVLTNNGSSDLESLMELLKSLQNRLDNFQGLVGNKFEDVINNLCGNLTSLEEAVKGANYATFDSKALFGNDFVSIANEINRFREEMDAMKPDNIWDMFSMIGDYADAIRSVNIYKEYTGIYENKYPGTGSIWSGAVDWATYYLVDKFINPNLGLLNTSDNSDFVAAINELVNKLQNLDVIDSNDLELFKKAIVGGGVYVSLPAIATVFEVIYNEIGSKSADFDATDIYEAVQALDSAAGSLSDMLGENKTDYPDVWTAINDLRTQLAARSINSLVYIPEYDDGKADADTDGSNFSVELKFKVNAPAALADVLASGNIPVKGLLRTASSSGLGTEINGTAVYAEGILTASFFAHQRLADGSSIALMIGSPADGFISQYVPLEAKQIKAIKRIDSADPVSGTVFKFLSGFGDAYSPVIIFKPVFAGDDLSDIKGNVRAYNLELIENGLVRTIKASKGITRDGTVSFSDNVNTFTYTVQVNTLSDVMNLNSAIRYDSRNNRFYTGYNSSVTITFADMSEYGLSGSLSVSSAASGSRQPLIDESSISVEGNVITFNTLSQPAGYSRRSTLTIKVGDTTLINNAEVRINN